MGLFSLFTKEIAIDLGTANTVILHENKVVVDEPSIIAMNFRTKAVVAVGKKALMMEGKTSGDIITVRPLKNGVIADFQAAESMLREFIKMTNMGRNLFSPAMKMVICIPSGITEVEERAVRESAEQAGAKEVRLIYEPMAAAIGSGIDVLDANGNMIIDIGGGTSEVAVIALGSIAAKKSVQVAGDRLNTDIKEFMRREHNLDIGLPTAEQIKINVGAAIPNLENPPTDYEVSGRDLVHGIPRSIQVNHQEVASALNNSINAIEDAVMQALNVTPAELSADIYKTGIYLAGGGSLLRGLDKRISKITQLPVHVVEDPLRAVARGTAIALKNLDKFESLTKY
ncbi:MAG: rod shape-determining protein [Bacteroidales bacterium]|nr:rod shape-determining protein [Bacteroidales bacterium]MDY6348234.1 rod shape-determining protein [Bacteroidales bacterium]